MKSLLAIGAITGALTLAACGGGSPYNSSDSPGPVSGGQTVAVVEVDGIGRVLTDSTGRALYSPDEEADGRIRCTDECTSFWTPLTPGNSSPTAAPGVGKLSVISRPDGTPQVTADGKPLYTFTEDSTGDLKGNGLVDAFGGQQFTWHAVLADGTSASAPGSTGGGSDTGYGA